MTKRHDSLGVKQVVRFEWMERSVDLLKAGFSPKEIRHELDDYLSCRKQSGGLGERGQISYQMAVGILMRSWVTPSVELVSFSNAAKNLIKGNFLDQSEKTAIHWAVISAAYPFWFNVARQVGRLLNLQDQITSQQIVRRLKEQYGDRQTVSRVARYVVRSFVAWGVLKDTDRKGCYEQGQIFAIDNPYVIGLLLEGALHTVAESKSSINTLYNNPGFYMFKLPLLAGELIVQANPRLEMLRFGLDEEILQLKVKKCVTV